MKTSSKKALVLAIDVGNTSIAFGLFEGKKLVRPHRVMTHAFKPASLKPFARYKGRIEEAIINRNNIARCCAACNSSKGAKLLLDWIDSHYCKAKCISRRAVAPIIKNALRHKAGIR